MNNLHYYENLAYDKGYKVIAGTDEVGRGPMAGPLVAAAVVLPNDFDCDDINDSKKLTPKKREKLYDFIMHKALEVSITFISVEDVDRLNVYQASKLAMTACLQKLKIKPDYVLTDAMKLDVDIPVMDIIKGDSKSISIAAASIIAKVSRDRYMVSIDAKYPMYGFKNHKGYVTKKHLEAIHKYGICELHRKSFAPVQEVIGKRGL